MLCSKQAALCIRTDDDISGNLKICISIFSSKTVPPLQKSYKTHALSFIQHITSTCQSVISAWDGSLNPKCEF